jgi:hypothetical protein
VLEALRTYLRRRQLRPGARLTQFIAKDIRRDVEVVDASEVDAGYITAKVRTWNVLHAVRGLAQKPELSEPLRLEIRTLWRWTGPDWGGPVPDDDLSRR